METPPYSPPPESPITPHPPPLAPDDGDILDHLGPLDYFTSASSTATDTPSESARTSESTPSTEITQPSDRESSAPPPPPPRRAKGGRRRRRGGKAGGRRASSLGTIVDVEEAGTGDDYHDDVARAKKRSAERRPTTEEGDGGRNERRGGHEMRESPEGGESQERRGSQDRRGSQEGKKQMIKKTIGDPVPIPRKADGSTPKLQIGLNLDVELELKAKLQGDISLALVAENVSPQPLRSPPISREPSPARRTSPPPTASSSYSSYLPSIFSSPPTPSSPSTSCSTGHCTRPSPELDTDEKGDANKELFHVHVGTLQLRQRWADREVSKSLTATVLFGVVLVSFLAGILATRAWDGVLGWDRCSVLCGAPVQQGPPGGKTGIELGSATLMGGLYGLL